jgi:hypothetical protein
MQPNAAGEVTEEQFSMWWHSTGHAFELPPERQAAFNQAVSYFQVNLRKRKGKRENEPSDTLCFSRMSPPSISFFLLCRSVL